MARRATNPEIIAAMNVMCDRDAEVTADALAEVVRGCELARWKDWENFDWREERHGNYTE